jgi:hypothetical protein
MRFFAQPEWVLLNGQPVDFIGPFALMDDKLRARPAVSIQGSPKIYTRTGDSGQQVVNRFCPDCGSTVEIEPAALPGTTLSQQER